ncbi:hypothetical protein BH18ACT4_BH18ACT4_12080 [soil metagenome]
MSHPLSILALMGSAPASAASEGIHTADPHDPGDPDDPDDRDDGRRLQRLAEIMGRLAECDDAAVFALLVEFGDSIRAALAHIARQRGYRRLDADDLDGLTADACFVLGRLGRGWRPDGALPWTWARHRLVNLVDDWAGPRTRPYDDARCAVQAPALAWADDDPDAAGTLAGLAGGDRRCALLVDALALAVPGDDHEVFLRYAMQVASGDPSPSHTVGAELGLKPPAVRQRASRARRRLSQVVASQPRFASLTDIALLAPRDASRCTQEAA